MPHSSPKLPVHFPILCIYLMGQMGLPTIGQPPEEYCYDCLDARKAPVWNDVGLGSVLGLGVRFGLVLRLRLVSGLCSWLFYLVTVRQQTCRLLKCSNFLSPHRI